MEQLASPMELSATQVVAHFKRALAAEEGVAKTLQAALNELTALMQTITDLPDKTRHDVRVPLGPLAFMPGQLIHTNELTVHLGDKYFAERSAKQTLDILGRRKASLESQLQACQKKVVELRDRVQAAERLAETDGDDLLEIREEYVEEVHGATPMRPAQEGNSVADTEGKEGMAAGGKDAPGKDPEFDALMARLEELEAAEVRADGENGQESKFEEQTPRGGTDASERKLDADFRRESPGTTKGEKRFRFAEAAPEGSLDDTREEGVSDNRSNGTKKKEKSSPLVGQIVERMDSDGEDEPSGSQEETSAAAMEPAEPSDGESAEQGLGGAVEEIDSEEDEEDRHFFEALRADASDGSSQEEEESDEDTEEEDEAGPSLETGRQVSADIQHWLARRSGRGAAVGGGVPPTSAYARESRVEDARARLRQRAEQLRNERERQLGGATTAETAALELLVQTSSPPAQDRRPQFASQSEKETAFHQFLYGEPAIASVPAEGPSGSEVKQREDEKAVLGGIVERHGAPEANRVSAAQDTVVLDPITRPKSRFKEEMRRRARGT